MANFVLTPQTLPQYQPVADNMWPGMPVREDVVRRKSITASNGNPPFVAETWTAQFTANGTDQYGLVVQGATYPITSAGVDETDAQAWITAHAATLVNAGILAAVPTSNGTGLLTLVFADGIDVAVTSYSPATADVAATETQAADGPDLGLTWGMGVIKDPSRVDPNVDLIVRRPKTADEVTSLFAGVIRYAPRDTDDARVARGFDRSVDIAPDQDFEIYIGGSMEDPFVLYASQGLPAATAAEEQDPAYLVFDESNPDWGSFRSDSGATGEIQTLTFANGGAGTAAGNFDGLLDISFADQGSNDANAARFVQEWNARPDLVALGSVSALAAVVTVAFADDIAHTWTDNSATITITAAQTQAPVAAIAADTGFKFHRGTVTVTRGSISVGRSALNMGSNTSNV